MNSRTNNNDSQPFCVTLEVVEGPHFGARFEFREYSTFLVGRGKAAHLKLEQDLHFSRNHFRVEIQPPLCHLIDLGSRSGTLVNGAQVQETYLHDGDVISGGNTRIRVTIVGAASTTDPISETVLGTRGAELDSPSFKAQKTLAAPVEIPGFALIDEIGRGSMGVVYSGTQKSTGKPFAIKLMAPGTAHAESSVQMFIREASVLAQLDHPHIVRFQEFGIVPGAGQLYLVMEYIRGMRAADYVERKQSASRIRNSCAIICQVLDALRFAHARSLVHRDVKPSNILISLIDGKPHVKLADFGLAKNYANAGFSGITGEGQMRGTLAYMPPEQAVDCRYAKPSCDIYATAATLYWLITGQLPYNFAADRNQIATILHDDPIPLRDRLPTVPAELDAIILRALEKEPDDRFGSADEMLQALKPFCRLRRQE